MRDKHLPREEFVEQLAGRLGADLRLRNRRAPEPRWTRWLLQSPIRAAAAAGLVIAVSMGVGGFVVVAAYQAQTNVQRSLLAENYRQRAELARQRIAMAAEEVRSAQQRVATGVESQTAVLEAQLKLRDAEAQLQLAELQLAEVQASGREPGITVSSPLVAGRDFVSERWRAEQSVMTSAYSLEQSRYSSVQERVRVGVANPADLEESRARMQEIEAARKGVEAKIQVRGRFLKREIDAAVADLRVLEIEAEQRRDGLMPRLAVARRVVQLTQSKVDTGVAQNVELRVAQLRLLELELELTKANLDLALIQRQIAQRGK
jgi:outer membrane protein TolC